MVHQSMTVESLEGPIRIGEGDYVCLGQSDELWAMTSDDLLRRYTPTGEVQTINAETWKVYTPRPARIALAAQMDEAFAVFTPWGVLRGKPGDLLLLDETDPTDLWVVDRVIFDQTYDRIGSKLGSSGDFQVARRQPLLGGD